MDESDWGKEVVFSNFAILRAVYGLSFMTYELGFFALGLSSFYEYTHLYIIDDGFCRGA